MNDLYIFSHLGLGDHILCNAIVRIYATKHSSVHLFVKPHNLSNVSYMFRDLININYIPGEDEDVKEYINMYKNNEYLIIGHTAEFIQNFEVWKLCTFDQEFYNMARLPFGMKWSKFYFERDLEKEKDIFYNKLGLKDDEEFLLFHDDPKNNYIFKTKYINPTIKIVRVTDHPEIKLFDFLYTIEKAKEVHVMNSSLAVLIDTIQLKHDNLNYHSYVRLNTKGETTDPKFKLNWKIL